MSHTFTAFGTDTFRKRGNSVRRKSTLKATRESVEKAPDLTLGEAAGGGGGDGAEAALHEGGAAKANAADASSAVSDTVLAARRAAEHKKSIAKVCAYPAGTLP
jgi:hypothetical protein